MHSRITQLKNLIVLVEKEFHEATDSGKSFYFKKEILQRLKLLKNELEQISKSHKPNIRPAKGQQDEQDQS